MPNAMDIAGPTLQFMLAKVLIEPEDTVLELLSRLQNDQREYNKYQHTPYYSLTDKMNEGENKDGDVVEEFMRRQLFNWLPGGSKPPYKILENFKTLSRTDVGILWNCGMVDQETVRMHASWDDAQLTKADIDGLLSEMMSITEQLAKEGNWDKKLSQIS
jgi:hypothetical protein